MSIIIDKKHNKYYINYKITLPSGERKNVNIRNKAWIISGDNHISRRYMESIEMLEIQKDKEKRLSSLTPTTQELTIGQLIDIFNKVETAQGLDPTSVYIYCKVIKKFATITGLNTPISKALTIDNIDKYRVSLKKKNLKSTTININLAALRKFIIFAKQRKYITRDNADDLLDLLVKEKTIVKSSSQHNYFLNGDEDLKKFIATFETEDQTWRVPLLTMFYGALRMGEWQAITYNDLDFENATICITKQCDVFGCFKDKLKNGEDKIVRVPTPFMKELKEYVEDRQFNNDDLIFASKRGTPLNRTLVNKKIEKHLKLANLHHMTAHGLRHSFATRMFDRGYDVKEVQKQLGHKKMATTMNYYIHYTQDKDKKSIDDLL